MKVKICGITNLEDALASVIAGCDAIGFVFYKKSSRYISPQKARNLCRIIPKHILKVGVFVNAKEKVIKHISRFCKLDMLQFHGDESPEFCSKFKKSYKIIKAFRIKNKADLQDMLRYKTYAYLFDTFVASKAGGTGKCFNWELIKNIRKKIKRPLFLSGGLNAKNVKVAIKTVRPDWVDVSSSVEIRLKKKDYNKIKGFINTVRYLKTRSLTMKVCF